MGNIQRYLDKNHPDLSPTFAKMYEASIDFGAHPNERGFSSNTSIRDEGDLKFIDTVYLHGDGPQLSFALKATVQVGIWVLLAFAALYPALATERELANPTEELKARY